MNSNRKNVKAIAFVAATSAIVAGAGVNASAAPLDAVSPEQAMQAQTQGNRGSLSGVSASLANILSTSTEASTSANETDMVTASENEAFAKIAIAHTDSNISVRESADENSRVVGYLYDNNAMTVESDENGWLKINSGDVSGYIPSEGVTVGDVGAAKAAQVHDVTVNEDGLRLREEANTDSRILTGFNKDTRLTGTDLSMQESGWVKVKANVDGSDVEGFVSNDFVSVNTHFNYGETVDAAIARQQAEQEAAAAAQKAAAEAQKRAAAAAEDKKAASTTSESSVSNGTGASVVSYAAQFLGNPYVWGGTSLTSGADCSGFVLSVYKHFGISLPHSSGADRSVGRGVSVSDMQAGDIVCYSGHVGIYAGNGKIINAMNPSKGITYTNVNYAPILAVRRVL